jgi:hypothetical protein
MFADDKKPIRGKDSLFKDAERKTSAVHARGGGQSHQEQRLGG